MGIKSLTYLIKQKCSNDCIEHKKLYELSGKTIAIDASLFIYQSLINIRRGGEPLKNKEGVEISHLLGIFNKTINLLMLKIKPIYVFDGKPPIEKKNIIDQRKKLVSDSKNQIELETDPIKINALKKKTVRLTYHHVNDIKQLLDLMGVSYIHMDGEAEGLASELCRIGYVDYIMTEDMDSLVFGCPKLIRKSIINNIKDGISIFNLENILKSLNITYNQFVELCILCGCDYCASIPKIGSITAFKLIKAYDNIDGILSYNDKSNKYSIPEDYLDKFNIAKKLFNEFYEKMDEDKIEINVSNINYDKLDEFMINKVNINNVKYNQQINKLKQVYSKR